MSEQACRTRRTARPRSLQSSPPTSCQLHSHCCASSSAACCQRQHHPVATISATTAPSPPLVQPSQSSPPCASCCLHLTLPRLLLRLLTPLQRQHHLGHLAPRRSLSATSLLLLGASAWHFTGCHAGTCSDHRYLHGRLQMKALVVMSLLVLGEPLVRGGGAVLLGVLEHRTSSTSHALLVSLDTSQPPSCSAFLPCAGRSGSQVELGARASARVDETRPASGLDLSSCAASHRAHRLEHELGDSCVQNRSPEAQWYLHNELGGATHSPARGLQHMLARALLSNRPKSFACIDKCALLRAPSPARTVPSSGALPFTSRTLPCAPGAVVRSCRRWRNSRSRQCIRAHVCPTNPPAPRTGPHTTPRASA